MAKKKKTYNDRLWEHSSDEDPKDVQFVSMKQELSERTNSLEEILPPTAPENHLVQDETEPPGPPEPPETIDLVPRSKSKRRKI